MTSITIFNRFRRSPIFKQVSYVVILCFTSLVCSGCVSIKVAHLPIMTDAETPSIAMTMYMNKPDAEEMDQITNGLQSSLYFKNSVDKYVQVSTSQNGQWLLKNAPAGIYRLELADSFEHNGKILKLSGNRTRTFKLPADKRAEIRIILKKTPVGLMILLTIVIVGVVIFAFMAKNDLSAIPLPPGFPVPVPPPPVGQPLPLHIFFAPVPSLPSFGPPPLVPVFVDYGVYSHPQDDTGER